jgi:hypothetical protein
MGSITTRSFYSAAVLFSVLLLYVQTSLGNDAGDQEARQAEIHLDQAIAEKDWAEVSKLLDGNFEWTDEHGQTQTRKQVLVDLLHFATNNSASSDIQTHFYGDLDLLFGFRGSIRFSHIWVKRAAGWKAFIFIDTPRPATSTSAPTAPVQGGCENPCRTVPYTPTTTTDKTVLAEWQKTKIDEWQPNVADWEAHSADEVLIITNKGERNKSERLAIAKKNQQEHIGVPGDPVLRMKMSDFDNTVVMISDHSPNRGGKPYHNVRLFVNRAGHWMIAWSQQTTMDAGTDATPVAGKQ